MDEKNPYQPPPLSNANAQENWDNEVPDSVLKKIRTGWILAIVAAGITTLAVVFVVMADIQNAPFNLFALIDVVFVLLLAFGVYKRSRTAATVLLIYYLLAKLNQISMLNNPLAILVALFFLFSFFNAMIGTFQYHRIIDKARSGARQARVSSEVADSFRDLHES